jgi:uncharacterized protein YoxC
MSDDFPNHRPIELLESQADGIIATTEKLMTAMALFGTGIYDDYAQLDLAKKHFGKTPKTENALQASWLCRRNQILQSQAESLVNLLSVLTVQKRFIAHWQNIEKANALDLDVQGKARDVDSQIKEVAPLANKAVDALKQSFKNAPEYFTPAAATGVAVAGHERQLTQMASASEAFQKTWPNTQKSALSQFISMESQIATSHKLALADTIKLAELDMAYHIQRNSSGYAPEQNVLVEITELLQPIRALHFSLGASMRNPKPKMLMGIDPYTSEGPRGYLH